VTPSGLLSPCLRHGGAFPFRTSRTGPAGWWRRTALADVDEVRRTLLGRNILLGDFEMDCAGILVAFFDVVDRHRKTLASGVFRGHRSQQVGCEGGNAALARQVVAEERDLSNLGPCFHKFVCIIPCPRKTRTVEPGTFECQTTNHGLAVRRGRRVADDSSLRPGHGSRAGQAAPRVRASPTPPTALESPG